MIELVSFRSETLAIILRASYYKEGIEFFTPDDYSQQLAYMNRPTGYVIPPHVHNPIRREVQFTKEVLFIKSGKVRVDFYSEDKVYVESRFLRAGGFLMLENSEIIEVKQGPYAGDKDKTRFDPVNGELIKTNGDA